MEWTEQLIERGVGNGENVCFLEKAICIAPRENTAPDKERADPPVQQYVNSMDEDQNQRGNCLLDVTAAHY